METPMEVESEDEKYLSVWDELGKCLDDDMPPEDLQQAMQLLKDMLPSDFHTDLPSDVLRFLRHNYPEGKALSVMKHVLGTMKCHHQSTTARSYKSLFGEYEKKLKAFDKNETFVGRKEELNEILEMFSSSSKILGYWIHGRSGMGKTTLAEEVCWNVLSRTAINLIQLNLSETTSFTDMMMGFQRGTGYYLSTEPEKNLVNDVLNCVQEIKQDTLILFDNIEEVYKYHEEQLESFIAELIKRLQTSKVKIRAIFTSILPLKNSRMRKLEALKSLHLHELSRENAKELLLLLSNRAQTDASKIDDILKNTELTPQKLAFKHHALSFPQGLISNFPKDVDPDVLFAFRHLSDERQKELSELMIFETSLFDDEDAGAALDKPISKVSLSLLDLINSHLIQEGRELANADDTEWKRTFAYRIHPDVFSSLRKITDSQENKEFGHCRDKAFRRFSRTTIERMVKECKDFEMFYEKSIQFVWQSSTRMKVLFNFLSENHLNMSYEEFNCLKCIPPLLFSFERRNKIIEKVATAYRTQGDDTLQCFWQLEQVKIFIEVKNYKTANEILETVKKTDSPIEAQKADVTTERVDKIGLPEITLKSRSDAILKAEYYLTKGRIMRGLSKYKDAMQKQKAALKILEEWAPNDIPRQAAVCNAIGNILHDVEEYGESCRYHQKAVDIMKGYVKEGPTSDMSVYLFNIGTISYAKAHQMKKYNKEMASQLFKEALKYYTESIDFDKKWKLDCLNRHSEKLKIRAGAFRELKQFDKAIEDVQKSVKLKEKLFPKGPWSSLILGYYQIGELFVKKSQTLLNQEVKGSYNMSRNDDKLLKESWKWLNRAVHLIKEKKERGISPDDVKIRCFAKVYKEVAYSLSDSLGKEAELFCTAFQRGEFITGKFNSSDDESSGNNLRSSNGDDDIYGPPRHDSGIEDIVSDMETEHTFDIPTDEQPSISENDGVFSERHNEVMLISSKRKQSE